MQNGRTKILTPMVADYIVRQASHPTEVIVLLHGYFESGKRIYEKLQSVLPPHATVLSPNGLFPIPKKTDEGYKIGFSWYLYDPATDEYFIDMQPALEFLTGLLKELNLEALPLRVIGFSQGGYLAPFFGMKMKTTRQVIGIASEFLADELARPISFRMDSIHGANDLVVAPDRAAHSAQRLKADGIAGEFHLLPNVDHRITEEVRECLKQLLAKTV